jgi:FkbM family methyltransferase
MLTAAHSKSLSPYQRSLQALLIGLRPAPLASFLKRVLGNSRTVVATPQGKFLIDPISNLGVQLSRNGFYEPGMRKTIEMFLTPGATFVDLGANEGYFTVIGAKRCGASGRVVAIEPQERLLPVIKENLRMNGVEWASVLNVAVTDTDGVVTLHLNSDTNTGASGLHRHTKYLLPTQQVAARTLSQVLDGEHLMQVDLMKVDIEGFEYEALLASPEVFKQHRVRALALELHPTILANRNKDTKEITGMLAACNYRMIETFGNTVWLAPGPDSDSWDHEPAR